MRTRRRSYAGGRLTIAVRLPIDRLQREQGNFPASGLDNFVASYTDAQGQAGTYTYPVTFFASDSGWIFVSLDGAKQYMVYGVNGAFFDQYWSTVNSRNLGSSASSLQPCGNIARYSNDTLLPNQLRPANWVRDGIFVSSMSATVE